MSLPPKLVHELAELRGSTTVEVVEEADLINLVFTDFPLGQGFNMACCDLLVRVPRSYPDVGPDMFWTTPQLTFRDGRIPQAAEVQEEHIGKTWRRFSWHHGNWNCILDGLPGYLDFIRLSLRQSQKK